MKNRWMCMTVFALLWAGATSSLAVDARLAGRLDAETAGLVQAVVDSALAERLPGEVIIQRALEGATKGAPTARIVDAVQALLQRLRVARHSLGDDAGDPALAAGAEALRAGVAPPTLATLSTVGQETGPTSSPSRLTVALVVLSDLVARGVPVEAASNLMVDLMRTGVHDDQLIRLRQRVEQDIRSGMPPQQSATYWARHATDAGRVSPRKSDPITREE